MIDHVTLGVADFDRALRFYDAALAPLGISRLFNLTEKDGVPLASYGATDPSFWLVGERPTRGLMHIAFRAKDRAAVDQFHKAALQAGGTDHGAPGLRPHYHATYYAAFVLDPAGHNIEAVCHDAME